MMSLHFRLMPVVVLILSTSTLSSSYCTSFVPARIASFPTASLQMRPLVLGKCDSPNRRLSLSSLRASDSKDGGKSMPVITRRDLLLALTVSTIPAFFASLLAGLDAPPDAAHEAPNIAIEEAPSKEALARRQVDKWEFFESEPQTFEYTYASGEGCYFLEGEVKVTPKGVAQRPLLLKAGNFAFFPQGMTCTWEVTQKVRLRFKQYKAIAAFE